MRTRIREGGYIFTETRAKKQFDCCACGKPIFPSDDYLKVERGGGGVSWSVHPDRIHNSRKDIERYLKECGF